MLSLVSREFYCLIYAIIRIKYDQCHSYLKMIEPCSHVIGHLMIVISKSNLPTLTQLSSLLRLLCAF